MADTAASHGPAEVPRRDFLLLVAGTMGAVGAATAIWPFIDSLEPARDTLAAGAPIEVDLSPIQPGQQIVAVWRGRPIWIMRRTDDQLKLLQSPTDTGLLADPDSKIDQQPDYAKNWHRSVKPEFVVLVGICTHLGCVPSFQAAGATLPGPNWIGGYFCPCHGSKYDFSGRVYANVPAPYNLPVPPYHFLDDKTIRVGENPPGAKFDLNEIEQI